MNSTRICIPQCGRKCQAVVATVCKQDRWFFARNQRSVETATRRGYDERQNLAHSEIRHSMQGGETMRRIVMTSLGVALAAAFLLAAEPSKQTGQQELRALVPKIVA